MTTLSSRERRTILGRQVYHLETRIIELERQAHKPCNVDDLYRRIEALEKRVSAFERLLTEDL